MHTYNSWTRPASAPPSLPCLRRPFGADIPVREYGARMVRLAQIEVYPERLEEYLSFAKEVGTVSMASEPGASNEWLEPVTDEQYKLAL
ncbi:MAG: hypothetical protein IJ714_09470 [Bacteroidales bacterium]|nr:hypothetical protein [Bacteroidales bacterium]